jgi:hypothetical protein
MIRQSLLALALIGLAGVASAQTVISSPPQPSPGDYQRQAPGLQPPSQQAPDQQAQMAPSYGDSRCGHQVAMRDEYGFRYDSQGSRLNGRGCVISPQNTTP